MNTEESRGEIEKLNEELQSRHYKEASSERHEMKDREALDVREKWQSPPLEEVLKGEREAPPSNSLMKKAFVFSLLFFIAAIIVAGFVFLGGANFISSKNVEVNILGPTMASAGKALELGVSVLNKNNADLEVANLSIQYPTGTRSPSNTSETLTFSKEELGVIKAGRDATRNVRVVLLGSVGETKIFKFSVEYRVKGSNATFYKDKLFEVVIGDAPLTIAVDSPESITSGEEFETKVYVTLNAPDILKGVVLKVEYPYGYTPTNSSPLAGLNNNIWMLGDLSPGDKKTISMRGKLVGQNEEDRTFRFYAGVSDDRSLSSNLKIALTSILNTVSIKRPLVALNAVFNGENTTSFTAPLGQTVSVSIRFQNNMPDKILNPRLEARLAGGALNKSSVTASNSGFYDSLNSKIIWQISNSVEALELLPGEDGQVSFSFSSLPQESLPQGSRDISVSLLLVGVPLGGREAISVSESYQVKIASQLNFSAKALRSGGPFTNRGPLPPKAEKETTYTIIFRTGNTQGDVTPASVTARLGPGVKWVGASSSGSEDLSYNEASNVVTWDLGSLPSGSGFSAPIKEAAFQVALTPSTSQIGTAPVLVSNIAFTGRDLETGADVRASAPALNTRLTEDPSFIQGDGIVQK